MAKKNNDFLGETSIGKLLFQMSLPAAIGMLVMTLYNLVDSIFIGHFVGKMGLSGVTVVFPFMMLVIALAVGFGIGAASIISRRFGEKNIKEAQSIFENFIFINIISVIFLSLIGFLFTDQILYILGATEGNFIFAKTYFTIIIMGMFFQMFVASFNNIIRSEGAAKTSMFIMILGAVVNIILDFVFIYYFKMGIAGAAYATVISQIFSFVFILYYFIFSNRSHLKLTLGFLKPKWEKVKEILIVGFPTFGRQSSMSLVGIIMNNSLRFYGGDLAIAAYGVAFRLVQVLVMPSLGILQGAQPIIGYNYGAKKYSRVKQTLMLAIKSTTFIIIVCYIFLMIWPKFFVMMFTTEQDLLELGTYISRIMFFFLPLIGYQFIIGGYFQSLGKAKEALLVSLLRQLILFIPLMLILPLFFGLNGLWFTFPISDFFAFIITYFIMRRELKLLNSHIEEENSS